MPNNNAKTINSVFNRLNKRRFSVRLYFYVYYLITIYGYTDFYDSFYSEAGA